LADGRRVVVTGLGIISSIGQDVASYWQSLLAARSGIRRIAAFDPSAYSTQIGGEVPDFDPLNWFDKRAARRMDRFSQMGAAAAAQAVRDAGLDFDKEDPARCGVIIGTGIGGFWEIEEQFRRMLDKGPGRVSPLLVPKLMANACAGQVSSFASSSAARPTS